MKQKVKTNEDNQEKDTNDLSSTGDESEDGNSDASFEIDTDEEIDTTEIEEEDWVDYIKRSTNEDIEKMVNEKIRCWNKTHKKWNGD